MWRGRLRRLRSRSMQTRRAKRGQTPAALFWAVCAAAPVLTACETIFEAQAVREHPAPGRLVDVGSGRHLQIDCRGDGAPTVVFQSGGDLLGSLAWGPVMTKVAERSRACAYSRAGILWSDPARAAFEPQEVAHDLQVALAAAGETGPYLLVSHSRGGLYSMIFAGLYSREIAGLVLVDSSHPDQEAQFRDAGLAVGFPIGMAGCLAFEVCRVRCKVGIEVALGPGGGPGVDCIRDLAGVRFGLFDNHRLGRCGRRCGGLGHQWLGWGCRCRTRWCDQQCRRLADRCRHGDWLGRS